MQRTGTTSRTTALAALMAGLALMLSSRGGQQPDPDPGSSATAGSPTTSGPAPGSTSTTSASSTTTPPSETTSATAAPEPSDAAIDVVQSYLGLLAHGMPEVAFALLSPKSHSYFRDAPTLSADRELQQVVERIGVSETTWAARPAYEETYASEMVVTVWGQTQDGAPFAHAWGVRTLDDGEWVIDQDLIGPYTGEGRISWLNPGVSVPEQPHLVNPASPLMFALLKERDVTNVAVTASVDDGAGPEPLTELPTDGAVQYELSDHDVTGLDDGVHALTVSWVAEDEPFVHVRATPVSLP
jgi:hypothetical protein